MGANGKKVDINRAATINLGVVCAAGKLHIVECLPVFQRVILNPVSTPEAVKVDAVAAK